VKRISHIFSKAVVVYCILYVSYAGIVSLHGQQNGADMTPLFIAISTAFMSELAMTLIQHMKKKKEQNNDISTE